MKSVKSSGNSTISRQREEAGQRQRPAEAAILPFEAVASKGVSHRRARGEERPVVRLPSPSTVGLLLQAGFLRELVELLRGEVERLFGILLAGDREVELAAERLDELHRIGEGRKFLRRRDQHP